MLANGHHRSSACVAPATAWNAHKIGAAEKMEHIGRKLQIQRIPPEQLALPRPVHMLTLS